MTLTHSTKHLLTGLFLIFFALTLHAQKSKTVSTVEELVNSLQSDMKITLLPGRYNLSDLAGKIRTAAISWQEVFDGQEMVVSNVSNLTIIGKAGAEIVVDPRYAWVIRFNNSKNIQISNLTMGHTEKGSCVGGVLGFYGGEEIKITNSILYGSGTEGVRVEDVNNFTFSNSVIKECTYNLMTLKNADNTLFENSAFLNTGEYDMVLIEGSGKIEFKDCMFRDNVNSGYFPHFFTFTESDASVKVEHCQFINNQVSEFSNVKGKIKLVDNTFKFNGFEIPK